MTKPLTPEERAELMRAHEAVQGPLWSGASQTEVRFYTAAHAAVPRLLEENDALSRRVEDLETDERMRGYFLATLAAEVGALCSRHEELNAEAVTINSMHDAAIAERDKLRRELYETDAGEAPRSSG